MTLRTAHASGWAMGTVAVAATAPVELNNIEQPTKQPTKALDPFMIALPMAK
jgi:hypothetical protein